VARHADPGSGQEPSYGEPAPPGPSSWGPSEPFGEAERFGGVSSGSASEPPPGPASGAPVHRPTVAPRRTGLFVTALIGAIAALLVAALCIPGVAPGVLPGVRGRLPWFPPPACGTTTVVEVVSAPLVADAVTSLVSPLQGRRMADGSCLSVQVRGQEAADTIASSAVLPPAQAPQLWISESSLWPPSIHTWKQRVIGSFATTPVVMVSSSKAVTAAGWTTKAPTWAQVFAGAKTLSVPGLGSLAQGELAMIALWQSAGKGPAADRAVAAATLAAARGPALSPADALSQIVNPAADQADKDAPFVATTEQAMVAVNRDSTRAVLTPVYPAEGTPILDFPIVRIAEDQQDAQRRAGTDLVIGVLTSPQAKAAAHALGLRDGAGGDPPTRLLGVPATVKRADLPPAADLTRFQLRWAALSVPSRLLTVIDVSGSMQTTVPGAGMTRLQLAGRAAAAVGELLPDTSSVGLWAFSLKLDGAHPYRPLASVATLGSLDNGDPHRAVLQHQLLNLGGLVAGGGTGLYVTALDAVRAMRSSYDPRTVNSVVLLTDGDNQDDTKLTLDQLVDTLKRESTDAPDRPVRLLCVGLGPQANMRALQAMAEATGGSAYQAQTTGQLQDVLYDAISRRS